MIDVTDICLLALALLLWRLVKAVEAGVHVFRRLDQRLVTLSSVPSSTTALSALDDGLAPATQPDKQSRGNGIKRNDFSKEYPVPVAPVSPSSDSDGSVDGASMMEAERPILLSAEHFMAALQGDTNVDVYMFMHASKEFSHLLHRLGNFTKLMIREARTNMRKIDQTYQLAPNIYRSMHSLLEAECKSGMHDPGGVLADPSSAMGLLWARRALCLWVGVFERLLAMESWEGSVSLKQVTEESHKEVLKPFNGWVSRSSFSMAVQGMPDWQQVYPKMGPDEKTLREDLAKWTIAVTALTTRMQAMHVKLDLEDKRKSI